MGRTGPRNFPGGVVRMKAGRVKSSRAATPTVKPGRAASGVTPTPPAGGGMGPLKSVTSMASMTGQRIVNRGENTPKKSMSMKPRADIKSKI